MDQIQYEMRTAIGPLYLVASKDGLQGVFFNKRPIKSIQGLGLVKPEEKILSKAVRQIEEYFTGKRKQFDISLNFSGTVFQKQVWRELSKIPFGKTASYSDIARRVKNPRAVRAVGSANGKNPACIIIPCHRVIAADGSIGGYSGGIKIKQRLLKFEQINSSN